MDGVQIARSGGEHRSFSFFRYIVLSDKEGLDTEDVIRHEILHYNLGHSLDRIWAELASCFFWMNPLAWSYKKDVKNNCEFQVDKALASPSPDYAAGLASANVLLKEFEMANSYVSRSNVMKRIRMMGKSASPRYKGLAYTALLPVALLALSVFSCSREADRVKQENVISGEEVKDLDQMPKYSGGSQAMIEYMKSEINYPSEAKEKGISGIVYTSFIVRANGEVSDVKVMRGVHPLLDEEAVRAVAAMPPWQPGVKDGQNVAVEFMLPISFKLPEKPAKDVIFKENESGDLVPMEDSTAQ